jgi:tetratricopeptide (TPR) repeat protein
MSQSKRLMQMTFGAGFVFLASFAINPMAFAMGGDSTPQASQQSDPDYAAGKQAIDQRDWATAVDRLTKALVRNPKSADIHNYLGFAQRKSGNYEKAFLHYTEALKIDPNHRGAHEYIGEAYLEQNNLARAEEHLKALDRICTFGCKEYSELKDRIAAYKAKSTS